MCDVVLRRAESHVSHGHLVPERLAQWAAGSGVPCGGLQWPALSSSSADAITVVIIKRPL